MFFRARLRKRQPLVKSFREVEADWKLLLHHHQAISLKKIRRWADPGRGRGKGRHLAAQEVMEGGSLARADTAAAGETAGTIEIAAGPGAGGGTGDPGRGRGIMG